MGITVVLHRLAQSKHEHASRLYGKLMGCWGYRPDRKRVTVKLGEQDIQLLETFGLNGILGRDGVLSGWVVTYQHPQRKELEVVVRSRKKPPKRRTFKVGGSKRRLVAVKAVKIKNKEAVRMATKTKKGKKAVDEDELDELEGLEDLDDLEELEDEEEPDDEDEDEDEDEEEEPAPKRRAKSKAKAKPAAKSKSRSRKAAAEEEDDEDEDDEDEDEAPARKRSAKSKTSAKSKAKPAAKKSSNGKGNLPATRELPKGQVGPQEIAEMVGGDCDARYVRIHLRNNDWERDEGSRWAFSKTEAKQLVREVKAARKAAGV